MRLWSVHPKYLDSKGLVALWREALLAKNVLLGNTKGYVNHPQLDRFKGLDNPVEGIDTYLYYVYLESRDRGFRFDKVKFSNPNLELRVSVNSGQVDYEWEHLLKKLELRDMQRFEMYKDEMFVDIHPMFEMVSGEIEVWERV